MWYFKHVESAQVVEKVNGKADNTERMKETQHSDFISGSGARCEQGQRN